MPEHEGIFHMQLCSAWELSALAFIDLSVMLRNKVSWYQVQLALRKGILLRQDYMTKRMQLPVRQQRVYNSL